MTASATHPHPSLLLAGTLPGGAAGLAVSSEVLLPALQVVGNVSLLTHAMSLVPFLREERTDPPRVTIGTLPIVIHAEGLLAGGIHRARLRCFEAGWAVGSRHASALLVAGVPYAVWEATTIHDELRAIPSREVRRAGRGTSLGARLHRALQPLGDRMEALVYRRATLLIAMSEYSRTLMVDAHGIAPERVHLLPPPPSGAFLHALERRPPAIESLRDDTTRLLFVGRVDDPRKNFSLLIDAVNVLAQRGIEARVTVVGPHTAKWSSSWQHSAAAERISLAGQIPTEALADTYRTHDLLVVPSRQEGYGLIVAEALHAGLPVVSTRCGGPEGMLRDSGGGVLTGHTALEFAAGIERLVRQPAERRLMAERARAYAQRDLSPHVFAARVAELTSRLLARPLRQAA